jgi:2-methylcitrate dehydratase PrpD
MATLAHQIAERIHRPRYEDITQAALEWTRTAFIDTVGVTLAGIVEAGPRILMQVPGIATAPGPSLIFATDVRTSALDATLVNGTASHALDYDDVSGVMGGHPSVMLIPPMIALAEQLVPLVAIWHWPTSSVTKRNAASHAVCTSITTTRVGTRPRQSASSALSRPPHGCCALRRIRQRWRSASRHRSHPG